MVSILYFPFLSFLLLQRCILNTDAGLINSNDNDLNIFISTDIAIIYRRSTIENAVDGLNSQSKLIAILQPGHCWAVETKSEPLL